MGTGNGSINVDTQPMHISSKTKLLHGKENPEESKAIAGRFFKSIFKKGLKKFYTSFCAFLFGVINQKYFIKGERTASFSM